MQQLDFRKREELIISSQTNLTTIQQTGDTAGPLSECGHHSTANFLSGSEHSGLFPAIKPKSDPKMRSKEMYIYIIYTGYGD